MLSYLYEIAGGVLFMFYLHLLGFGKERFSSISKKTLYKNCRKYHVQLAIILILIICLVFVEQDYITNK